MKISTQSKITSKITDNDLSLKIKENPDFRKTIVKNIKIDRLSKNNKRKMLKDVELQKLQKLTSNVEKYKDYNAAQIHNIVAGLNSNIDISFYDDINNSANNMALKRIILVYNKNNPDNEFNLEYFKTNNDNKVALLFEVHKYNVLHPDNKMDLNVIIQNFDLKDAKRKFELHKNYKPLSDGPVRSVQVEVKPEVKKKEPKIIEKNVKDMSWGELADHWNLQHPNAKINAELIYAQNNKKMAEMIYITSLYNLKFKNNRVSLNTFLKDEFTMEQKDEIASGIKYNLKNANKTIPFEKYMLSEIPADNMRIINKIMRLQAEYNVQADIDYIINNYKDRTQLNEKYEQLFKSKDIH